MYKIYIAEDDPTIAGLIAALAENWGLEAKICCDFHNVTDECRQFDPHLVLMDITLPYYDGYHWCREIRSFSLVPIIFLSSASDNLNMIMAMNLGADDFISKPFDGRVLIAKVQALLRRTYDFADAVPALEHRGAVLSTSDQTLSYGGTKVELTKNEYRILLCLLEQKGKVVSREALMERLWETDSFVDENTLTVNIGRLRKKLDGAGLEHFITTKVGVGYLIA